MKKLRVIKYKINKNCWECTSHALAQDGYPAIFINGKKYKIHRFLYRLNHPSIKLDKDIIIRHTCDNRKCINPKHLKHGSQYDNMQDKVRRNRQGNAKLKKKQIVEIFKSNIKQKELSKKFKVNQSVISQIKNKKAWKYITGKIK